MKGVRIEDIIMLDTPDIHRPDYVITMVADGLAPNGHQGISNYYADSIMATPAVVWVMLRDPDMILQPSTDQSSREVGRPTTRWFLC